MLGAAGGVGIAAVELGALLGARVIAAASSADKLAFCREHGATEGIDYSDEDLKDRIKALTSGNGVDVVYDPVGGALAEPALRGTAWEGRYLVIGFASGEIPKIPLNLVLLKGCQIVGVFWGSFAMREPAKNRAHAEQLFAWVAEGKLQPRDRCRAAVHRGRRGAACASSGARSKVSSSSSREATLLCLAAARRAARSSTARQRRVAVDAPTTIDRTAGLSHVLVAARHVRARQRRRGPHALGLEHLRHRHRQLRPAAHALAITHVQLRPRRARSTCSSFTTST